MGLSERVGLSQNHEDQDSDSSEARKRTGWSEVDLHLAYSCALPGSTENERAAIASFTHRLARTPSTGEWGSDSVCLPSRQEAIAREAANWAEMHRRGTLPRKDLHRHPAPEQELHPRSESEPTYPMWKVVVFLVISSHLGTWMTTRDINEEAPDMNQSTIIQYCKQLLGQGVVEVRKGEPPTGPHRRPWRFRRAVGGNPEAVAALLDSADVYGLLNE